MKIGMIFPGYTSQFVGMGKELYDESRVMQEYFEEASHCSDINFIKLCFASSDIELAKMQHAYASLFLVSCGIYAHLAQLGIQPSVVAGYNIGQLAAFHAAKGITFPDGLYVLTKLTQFIQELEHFEHYALARVKGYDYTELKTLLPTIADQALIISYEADDQCVVSAPQKVMDALAERLNALPKVKVKPVPTAFGLHSPIVATAIEQFTPYLQKVDFKDPIIPVIANSSAQLLTQGVQLRQEVLAEPQHPILWHQSMQQLRDCDVICTIGAAKDITQKLTEMYPDKQVFNILKPADVEQLQVMLAQSETKQEEPTQ